MQKFIEIRDLKKIYFYQNKPVKEALSGITLDIFAGEVLALLGANGAGKTTLSNILASLHPPSSGDILWKGNSIYKDIIAYRQMIGFCPQKPNLEKALNLLESLIFSGRCYGLSIQQAKKRAEELMERLDLVAYRDAFSFFLSGGYRQRFLIARALMHRPKLVILDEPTVGLDPHIRQLLWQTILSLKEDGVTVLLTTHYLDEAEKLSDRVCVVHEGMIRLIDTPDNLKRDFKKENLEDVFIHLMEERIDAAQN